MGLLIPLTLLGFPLIAVILFSLLPARRALMAVYLGGWLFLPHAGYKLAAMPDYGKTAAIALGAMLGVIIFDARRLGRFRFQWFDLPMLMFCLWPFLSHVYNGHGPLTGTNWIIEHAVLWGVPYFLGRIYFTRPEHIRELAVGIFIAGLVYAPLCWYEIRMSPQLNRIVYGFFGASFTQHMRYGGFRPLLFMQHGIMVGTWMASATLVGLWLWRSGGLRRFANLPMAALVPFMVITTIFCKVGSAIVALGLGGVVFLAERFGWRSAALIGLACIPPIYLAARTTGVWSGDSLVALVEQVDAERAGSLDVRMKQEDLYASKALNGSPIFGFADSRYIPRDDQGRMLTRGNDGFWIITFGLFGAGSLASVFMAMILPGILAARRGVPRALPPPHAAPITVLGLISVLFAIDCLANGMINPIYLLAAGAASSGGEYVQQLSPTLQRTRTSSAASSTAVSPG